VRLGVFLLTALVAVTACGSSGSNAQASVLTKVLQAGVLRVAVIVPSPGYAEKDAQGNYTGYEVDVANLLAKDLGVKTQFIETDNPGRVTTVQTGKADVAIATFTSNLTRMQVIDFTDPYEVAVQVLMAQASDPRTSLADFNKAGTKIAVATGGTQVQAVKTYLPLATEVPFPSPDDAIQAAISGQVDAAATGGTSIGPYMAANPGKLKEVQGTLGPPIYNGIGLAQGDFAWWHYLNSFVTTINNDGSSCAMYRKYFPGSSPGPMVTCFPS
jgi:polar amino acid transport system substrate-binding protein